MKTELPIACRLGEPALQERRNTVLQKIRPSVLEIRELEDGFAYHFPADDDWLISLSEFIRFERRRLTLRGIKPLAPSQHELEWSYLYGCVEPLTGKSLFLVLPALDRELFQLFLDQFAQTDETALHLVALDNGPLHMAQHLSVPANVRLVFTPPYTPEVKRDRTRVGRFGRPYCRCHARHARRFG